MDLLIDEEVDKHLYSFGIKCSFSTSSPGAYTLMRASNKANIRKQYDLGGAGHPDCRGPKDGIVMKAPSNDRRIFTRGYLPGPVASP